MVRWACMLSLITLRWSQGGHWGLAHLLHKAWYALSVRYNPSFIFSLISLLSVSLLHFCSRLSVSCLCTECEIQPFFHFFTHIFLIGVFCCLYFFLKFYLFVSFLSVSHLFVFLILLFFIIIFLHFCSLVYVSCLTEWGIYFFFHFISFSSVFLSFVF